MGRVPAGVMHVNRLFAICMPCVCACARSMSTALSGLQNRQDDEEEADEDSVAGLRIAEEADDGTARVLCARCYSLTHYGWVSGPYSCGSNQQQHCCSIAPLRINRALLCAYGGAQAD